MKLKFKHRSTRKYYWKKRGNYIHPTRNEAKILVTQDCLTFIRRLGGPCRASKRLGIGYDHLYSIIRGRRIPSLEVAFRFSYVGSKPIEKFFYYEP